ncbi:MAG: hypothetical protein R6V04_15060, partial [bacterium]
LCPEQLFTDIQFRVPDACFNPAVKRGGYPQLYIIVFAVGNEFIDTLTQLINDYFIFISLLCQ